MKQTNNAIKFLLAQYRAVYKHAYIKGVLSAALLTAGLASGVAQAEDSNWSSISKDVTVTGTSGANSESGEYWSLYLNGTSKAKTNDNVFKLTIQGTESGHGADNKNWMKGTVSASSGTLVIDGKTGVSGGDVLLNILGHSGEAGITDTTVTFKEVQVNHGTLEIKGTASGDKATLSADKITIGSSQANKSGILSMLASGSGSSNTIEGKSLSVFKGGTILVKSGDGSGSNVISSTQAEISGTLKLESGSKLNIQLEKQDNVASSFILKSGSESNISGTMTITNSLVQVESGAKLNASSSGAISVTTSGENISTLQIGTAELKNFLDKKGQVNINADKSGTATLQFAENEVDLAKLSIKFGNTSGASGTLSFSGGGTNVLKAETLKITNKTSNDNLNLSGATLRADNLVLGSSDYDQTQKITFSGADVKNLSVATKNNESFILSGSKVVLSNTLAPATGTQNQTHTALSGSISGKLTLSGSGSISVDGGLYTADSLITLSGSTSGGQISVNNKTQNDKSVDSSVLVLEQGLAISKTNSGTVSASGTGAVLDLTAGISVLEGTGESGTTLSATDSGTILFDANSINKIFKENPANLKLSVANDGILETSGDLNFAFVGQSGALANQFKMFGGIKDGILKANSLTITQNISNADKAFLKGGSGGFGFAQAKFYLNNFTFSNTNNSTTAENNYAYLNAGTFNVAKNFSSDSEKVVLSQDGNLTRGDGVHLVFATEKATDTGSISMSKPNATIWINNSQASGSASVKFLNGTWNASGVTFDLDSSQSGYLVIGTSGDSLQDNTNKASLNAYGLKLSDGDFNVYSNGAASFQTFAMTSGTANIYGTVTVSGLEKADEETKSHGISLSGGTINIEKGGFLDFSTSYAVQDLVTLGSGDEVTVNKGTTSLVLKQNGELRLNFADGTKLSDKQLENLKTGLFGTSNTSLEGFLNVGGASIGLEVKQDTTTGNYFVDWSDYSKYSDIKQNENVTTDNLKTAVIKGIDSTGASSGVKGSVGSLQLAENNNVAQITVKGNTSLNNASANNGNFAGNFKGEAVSLNVNNSDLTLAGSGKALDIILNSGSKLITTGKGNISLNNISGTDADVSLDSHTQVANQVKVNNLAMSAGSSLQTQELNVSGSASIDGNISVTKDAVFGGQTTLAGQNEFKSGLTLKSGADIYGNTTVSGKEAKFENNVVVAKNATLTTTDLRVAKNKLLTIGQDPTLTESGSSGFLQVDGKLELESGSALIIDPEYGQKASIAAVKSFSETKEVNKLARGGKINGDVILAQNSALMVGQDASIKAMQDVLTYFTPNGTLVDPEQNEDGVGAVLALNSKVVLGKDERVIIDPTRSKSEILGDDTLQGELDKADSLSAYSGKKADGSYTKADLYLGQGSILYASDYVLNDKKGDIQGIMHFDKNNASIKGEPSAKIVVGNAFVDYDKNVTLFTDNDTQDNGVLILDNDIRVESLNGLMYFVLKAGTESTGGQLALDSAKIDTAFLGASDPSRHTLLQVASNTVNYDEVYGDTTKTVNTIHVVGDLVSKSVAEIAQDGSIITHSNKYTANDFIKQDNKLYYKTVNQYLANTTFGSGIEADHAGRLAAFGGVAEAALAVNQANTDVIAARAGMGANNSALSYADNGQGAALFVSPLYKNHESDGFSAQGINYGVDMDMYGVALGGDFTMSNGLRMGLMFNVGSGDADGTQAAQGVKNEFDFFGVAAYAGYNMDKLSVVADLGYTNVDNEVSVTNRVDSIKSTMDSTALTLGVTGQYTLVAGGVDVVPHAGLRFTRIDIDDYSVKGAKLGAIGSHDSADLNVFSIPVGVTVSKEIVTGSWTVKPSFDFTVTGQFGDDTLDGTMKWAEYSNVATAYSSEVLDSFTYGATLGVAAKSGNFSLGLGANYTGSSSVKEYGINANARFVF